MKKEKQESFYSKQLQEKLRLYPVKINRFLRELESRNLINRTGGNRKNGYEYEIARWDDYEIIKNSAKILDNILVKIKGLNGFSNKQIKYNTSITEV